MKLRILIPSLFIIAVVASSCVSSKKYKELQANYDKLDSNTREMKGRYLLTERNLGLATERVKSLDEQLASERSNNKQLQSALDKCLTSSGQGNLNISKLVDEINSSNKYIQQLVNAKNKSDSLNMVLTNNLTRSLSQSEIQDVDVKVLKGVVYISLSDNMLYKSGSYDLTDKAGTTLSKIAKIIKDYANYDVLIEGNTDNVPITMKNIRNNWDLSALRASSVVLALQTTYQVDPKRLTAGGRGEYNPIADNSTAAGKAQNRRTQIIITPKLDQFMDLIGKAPETAPIK
ncbi:MULTISPECIES: OmpA family protein [unclassified Mucilaginibacter]|uniref:OmpA family protein n=1 Tax=unclassified Mucilaginibacter TaxID=2617802 RepID=UPI002AC8E9E7|nr:MULTISPECIES: OmpA family protein [unclassified Mucilaginibacter]MEB0249096.1 OmpA family protein [Mucilaginibacter sp. 5B2]MEB0261666.1 OmpA family protein [Mucilaginibacter sp. 10I4]MEB0278316.1 OmpA family protein [Mucilaginibacter sp. 10B2]MEB0301185.1 OmpA family protein [Mucilaginibacter sp. 5C4]WPX23962.1 OmpA family protein [Mucilaginibacter sp. 5C4]